MTSSASNGISRRSAQSTAGPFQVSIGATTAKAASSPHRPDGTATANAPPAARANASWPRMEFQSAPSIRCEKTVEGGSAVATTTATASARSSQARCSRRAGQRAVELTVTLPRPWFAGLYVPRFAPARRARRWDRTVARGVIHRHSARSDQLVSAGTRAHHRDAARGRRRSRVVPPSRSLKALGVARVDARTARAWVMRLVREANRSVLLDVAMRACPHGCRSSLRSRFRPERHPRSDGVKAQVVMQPRACYLKRSERTIGSGS